MSETVVLDACALIAFFNDEEGATEVAGILENTANVLVSGVNVLEVAYDAVKTTRDVAAAERVISSIEILPCAVQWALNRPLLLAAAELKAKYHVSLADAIALALAKTLGVPLASSDHHEFEPIAAAGEVQIIWIR